jgi:hypothetical protein
MNKIITISTLAVPSLFILGYQVVALFIFGLVLMPIAMELLIGSDLD